MGVISNTHQSLRQEKNNESKMITQAYRYPKKQNLINLRTSVFAGLALFLLVIALILTSPNPLLGTFPPIPQPNVNLQVLPNQTYGGTRSNSARALIQTSDGDFTLAGYTEAPSGGYGDMWFAKTDTSGVATWDQTYGGTGRDVARALIQTSDRGFALAGQIVKYGENYEDMCLVKTNANGDVTWSQTYGIGWGSAYALIQTSDGGFALAGRAMSLGTFEGGIWLVKTDASGGETWDQIYGGVWDSAKALIQTSDGGFALAGHTYLFGAGEKDMWLVKTDANGVATWNQTYGGFRGDSAQALIQTSDGGFVLAGDTESFGAGDEDMWLVKTDANGVAIWNQTYGGTLYDEAYALIQTSDDGFALAGDTKSFGAGDEDMWLVKTDANGVAIWNQTYGGTRSDSAQALIQTSDGGFALAGDTESFGAGEKNMWLVKTDANGVVTWNQASDGGFTTITRASPSWSPLILSIAITALLTYRKRMKHH